MKLSEGLVLTSVADEYVVVPVGDNIKRFIIRLNESGKDIFQGISDGLDAEQIAAKLVAEYEGLDLEIARKATLDVIGRLRDAGLLTEE